jgi:hypothetical protein
MRARGFDLKANPNLKNEIARIQFKRSDFKSAISSFRSQAILSSAVRNRPYSLPLPGLRVENEMLEAMNQAETTSRSKNLKAPLPTSRPEYSERGCAALSP